MGAGGSSSAGSRIRTIVVGRAGGAGVDGAGGVGGSGRRGVVRVPGNGVDKADSAERALDAGGF